MCDYEPRDISLAFAGSRLSTAKVTKRNSSSSNNDSSREEARAAAPPAGAVPEPAPEEEACDRSFLSASLNSPSVRRILHQDKSIVNKALGRSETGSPLYTSQRSRADCESQVIPTVKDILQHQRQESLPASLTKNNGSLASERSRVTSLINLRTHLSCFSSAVRLSLQVGKSKFLHLVQLLRNQIIPLLVLSYRTATKLRGRNNPVL